MITSALALTAVPAAAQEMDHSQHDMAGMDHSAHNADADAPSGNEVGNEAPPPVPTDHPARQFYPSDRMERSLAAFAREGSTKFGAVFVDQFEYRAVKGGDGFGWDAQAWYGGDINRAVLTTEGEGTFGSAPERAEVSALWRHAVDPYFNVEAGVRHDFNSGPQRTYAVLGVEGLAPYWFELEAQLLVSHKGDVHARLAASYDLRITQNLILQPDVEVNVAFQDVPQLGIGSGIERFELGTRLRYQFTPEFAPYVGVHWERSLGETASLMRAAGDKASAVSAVAGLRIWF